MSNSEFEFPIKVLDTAEPRRGSAIREFGILVLETWTVDVDIYRPQVGHREVG